MKFLFVCIGNSCRSQIAEAVARHLGYSAQSAGTEPTNYIHKNALEALKHHKINTDGLYSKHLDDIVVDDDVTIVSMGCGVKCPNIKIDYDFNLDDPKDNDLDYFINLVSIIEDKIKRLDV